MSILKFISVLSIISSFQSPFRYSDIPHASQIHAAEFEKMQAVLENNCPNVTAKRALVNSIAEEQMLGMAPPMPRGPRLLSCISLGHKFLGHRFATGVSSHSTKRFGYWYSVVSLKFIENFFLFNIILH